jgi:hypothetical protein
MDTTDDPRAAGERYPDDHPAPAGPSTPQPLTAAQEAHARDLLAVFHGLLPPVPPPPAPPDQP